jgi:hypothetical protein
MRALQQIEQSGDVGPLVGLFAENAELENPARSVTRRGRRGAEQFWREYLSAFGHVRSEFTRVREGDGFATLEWASEGSLPSGEPVSYRGVSLVEFGTDDDGGRGNGQRVRRFCTYYDSGTFLPQGSKRAGLEPGR